MGIVMVLLEKKLKKKRQHVLSYHRESQERFTYIREVQRACEWTGREKYRHQRRWGFFLPLEKTNLFITHKALLTGPTGR